MRITTRAIIARNFLFHPLGSLPAEGPGLEGVWGGGARGAIGGVDRMICNEVTIKPFQE